jgi:hypothetical protein
MRPSRTREDLRVVRCSVYRGRLVPRRPDHLRVAGRSSRLALAHRLSRVHCPHSAGRAVRALTTVICFGERSMRAFSVQVCEEPTDWPRNLNSACLGPLAARRRVAVGIGPSAGILAAGPDHKPTPFSAPLQDGFRRSSQGAPPGRDPWERSAAPLGAAGSSAVIRRPLRRRRRQPPFAYLAAAAGRQCRKPRGNRSVNGPSVVNPGAAGRAKAGPAWYLSPRELSALLSVARGPAAHQSALSRASQHPCCARLTQQLQRAPQPVYPPTPPFSLEA